MLVDAAAWHHTPRLATRFPLEVAVIHVADLIANGLGLGTSGEPNVPAFEASAWDSLGIPAAGLPVLFKQVEVQCVHAVTAILGSEH